MADNYLAQDGDKRAQELSAAWMGVSGYADDTMLFVARYSHKCSETLRKADYDRVIEISHEITSARLSGGDPAKISELRAEAIELLKEFPDLSRDFDRFVACVKTTVESTNRKR